MKQLVIVAHGSRSQLANSEATELAQLLTEQLGDQYHGVEASFLEMAEPSMETMCAKLYENGAEAIDIYPLFLNSGIHATRDIPTKVAEINQAHPKLKLKILENFGQASGLNQFIGHHIAQQTHAD